MLTSGTDGARSGGAGALFVSACLSGGHLATALGTTAAGRHALFHIADFLAAFGTGLTDLCAHLAQLRAEGGIAGVETGGGFANLGAMQHQFEMPWFSVRASGVEAMVKRVGKTGLSAGGADICALGGGIWG